MKSIMMSVQPKWVDKILKGEKTIEVRKKKPKLEPPFKVYIYCTTVKNMNLNDYVKLHSTTNGECDRRQSRVVAEFMCNEISNIFCTKFWKDCDEYVHYVFKDKLTLDFSCLEFPELDKYLKQKDGCSYHISDLVVYDIPKKLSDFDINKAPQSWCYVEEIK
ncbi:MAG: ASCH domain-containing protein [Longicatena sp.]|jgi:predicted transcriptional regulator